jgi:tetratricopeptide (TPR) repeat protein
MTPTLRSARLATVLLVALTGLAVDATSAFAADKEERRALTLDEASQSEKVSAEMKALADAKRAEAIEKLRSLLAATEDGDRKAEMMLRLADLYYEQGKSDYSVEMEKFLLDYDNCFNDPKRSDTCDQTVVESAYHERSYGWYGKSVKLYESVLKGYPRYAKADQATFYLGMTYQDLKRNDEGLEAFKRLVKLYPESQYVPDSYIFIGEYYFNKNEAFPALRAYQQATKFTEHSRYAYALYKLAWSYYNVDEFQNGIDSMKRVVAYSMEKAAAGAQSNQAIKLEEEALKDLVLFFADADQFDEAEEYFAKLGRKDLFRKMLISLAGKSVDQGKFPQAVTTYRRLIQDSPNDGKNPSFQYNIIDCYKKMGDKPGVIQELRRLRDDYGKSSAWAKANAGKPEEVKEAMDLIERGMRTTATEFNREAREFQKAKHPRAADFFAAAVDAYNVYLQDFNEDTRSYDIHWDFGELLWDLKRFDESYVQYMKVVSLDAKGGHSREASESAIFASEEMMKRNGTDLSGKPLEKGLDYKALQPKPLSEWELKFIDACKKYADLYPGDSGNIEVLSFKSAFLLYYRYHFAEASAQFRSVITKWPNSKNAEFSAELILDVLEKREEWIPLRDTAKAFFQTKDLGTEAFRKQMHDVYRNSSLKVILLEFEKNQDFSKTADDLFAYYKEFPEDPEIATILNDTAVYYFKSDRLEDTMKVRHILVEDPAFGAKTPYYFEQVALLGFDYERLADFDKSSFYYDKLVELYAAEKDKTVKARDAEKDATKKAELTAKIEKMEKDASAALYSSALFRGGSGDWQGAVERYKRFLTLFPTDARGLDIKLEIANTYEEQKQHELASAAFSDFYKTAPKETGIDYLFYARLHAARALVEMNKKTEATAIWTESADLYRKLKKAGQAPGAWSSYVAEMMYRLIEPEKARFMAQEIQPPTKVAPAGTPSEAAIKKEDKAIKDALQAKVKFMGEMEKRYLEVLDTGAGDWGMASLVALGGVYENMGTSLTQSRCPFYLNEGACEFYKMGLEDAAFPQSQKAVDVYLAALEKAYELNLYNENTALATRRLGDLRPAEFPGLKEVLPKPGFASEKTRAFGLEPSRD